MQIDLTPNLSLFAIMAIFIANCLVVRQFFLKPINNVLVARETETKTAESLYTDALARFDEATSQMEVQLHNAKREAAQVRERYRGEAAAYRAQVVERTAAKARQTIDEAQEKLAHDVKEARERITRDAENLARIAAERLLGRAV